MGKIQVKTKNNSYSSMILAMGTILSLCLYWLSTSSISVDKSPEERVANLLKIHPIIDTHNDLPGRLKIIESMGGNLKIDSLPSGHTDLERLRQGGVGGQFWSGYIPCNKDLSKKYDYISDTVNQIDLIRRMIEANPDLEYVEQADQIVDSFKRGKIASLIGLEGGHQIDDSLAALRQFYNLGARYMTLTHSCNTNWADSCSDIPKTRGLSLFGIRIIHEMNRLGMMVDISHVSHDVMKDVVKVSRAPLFASHSSAYTLCQTNRNIPDEILREMKSKDGVIMINFWSTLISCSREATLKQVADHIEHIASFIGAEHIGFGADYDGVDVLPEGLGNVSTYPALLVELAKRGFSDTELAGIMGNNLLRVMKKTEQIAKSSANVLADPTVAHFNKSLC
jgi:membrane dipeptidase